MSLLGPISLYLKVEFYSLTSTVFMIHHSYILKCLQDIGMADYSTSLVFMYPDLHLQVDISVHLVDPTYYRILLEKLLHLLNSHPDIAFAIGMSSSFVTLPRASHFEDAKDIFQYLKATNLFGIDYQKKERVIALS